MEQYHEALVKAPSSPITIPGAGAFHRFDPLQELQNAIQDHVDRGFQAPGWLLPSLDEEMRLAKLSGPAKGQPPVSTGNPERGKVMNMMHYPRHAIRSNYTLQEQRENREELAQALRSGQDEPLVVNGRFNKDGLSPSAIACNVSGLYRNNEWLEVTLPYLPENVQDWLGLTTPKGEFRTPSGEVRALMEIGGFTFEEIAGIIESPPEGLAVHEESIGTWEWEQLDEGRWEISIRTFRTERDRHTDYVIRKCEDSTYETTVVTRNITRHKTLEEAARTAQLHAQRLGSSRTRHILGSQQILT